MAADVKKPAAGSGRVRFSRQGAAIDEALAGLGGFHTAQELYDELRRREQPVGLATVYRQLKRLAQAGAVDVLTRPDGEAAYRLCGPAVQPDERRDHHHHLVCRICGYAVEISAEDVERWTREVARQAGFKDVSHTVEIFGDCGRHG